MLKIPHKTIITSLPVTPGFNFPTSSTLLIGGICHQVVPVAQIEAASVLTTGVPKHPYLIRKLNLQDHHTSKNLKKKFYIGVRIGGNNHG